MRFSVVIPAYNSAACVGDAVASALGQTKPPHEVIVVDDGSTDDTPTRLAVFGGSIQVIRKPNGGVSSARNRGVEAATGEYVAFLDADDVWHPRKLELQAVALSARPGLALLGTNTFPWPASGFPEALPTDSTFSEITFERLIVRNPLTTSSIAASRKMLREVGEFDSSLQGPEDFDMWLRMAKVGGVGMIAGRLTGYNEATPNSLSKNAARMERDTLRILAKQEADGTFQGRSAFRSKVYASNSITAARTYFDAGMLPEAWTRIMRSFRQWPLALKPPGHETFCARPRFAFAVIRRMIGFGFRSLSARRLESDEPVGRVAADGIAR